MIRALGNNILLSGTVNSYEIADKTLITLLFDELFSDPLTYSGTTLGF